MINNHRNQNAPRYGSMVGFAFIFNLIVGTGALTMPKAFELSGYILSSVLLVFLSFVSYVTATFMFESIAIANAVVNAQNPKNEIEDAGFANPNFVDETETGADKRGGRGTLSSRATGVNQPSTSRSINTATEEIVDENQPLIFENAGGVGRSQSYTDIVRADGESGLESDDDVRKNADKMFAIEKKYEMADMATLFFSKTGLIFFYLAMTVYLYGDLAIYNAAVSKSLRDTFCTYAPDNANQTVNETDPCWASVPSISRMSSYRIFVVAFNLLFGPLVFYDLQKTIVIQILTIFMRWLAFIVMIGLAIKQIADNQMDAVVVSPRALSIRDVPNFFGVCIYAFMCHHSLPGIITPIKRKETFKKILSSAYVCILIFYMINSFTGTFAFGDKLEDFYTLNFLPTRSKLAKQGLFLKITDYYLSLFPVFTISASFPIIAITLRNTLGKLAEVIKSTPTPSQAGTAPKRPVYLPLIALIPPLVISLITHNLQLLVGITGSYAGVCIQYIIPSCLVYFGRRESIRIFRKNYQLKHSFNSPFRHKYWVYFVLIWSNLSVIFVTVNHIVTKD